MIYVFIFLLFKEMYNWNNIVLKYFFLLLGSQQEVFYVNIDIWPLLELAIKAKFAAGFRYLLSFIEKK